MLLEKPKLFPTRRGFLLFVGVMLLVIGIRLSFLYYSYADFVSKPFYFTTAQIVNIYPKKKDGREYSVLKLKTAEGHVCFSATSHHALRVAQKVRIQLYPSRRILFWEYLGSFYVKSRIKEVLPMKTDTKERLMHQVASQHTTPMMKSFYEAIFFAVPISSALREKIALLGISHLVALSGFHLGILWSVIYGGLLLLYRPMQQRYFPYRFSLIDVGVVTMVCLGVYVWFVGFPPSLVRSYAMALVGWLVILSGVELLSFTFLLTVGLAVLALFPSLLASLGFWLSVSGVFYIFLLLQYTKSMHAWLISLFVIPLGIFLLMLPVVHAVFGLTTPWQLLSPLLSVLFIPFYPIAIFLHLIGQGALLDEGLVWVFDAPLGSIKEKYLAWQAVGAYLLLSLGAIRYGILFVALMLVASGYAYYLFV